jgi:hypothetical protein
MLLQDRSWVIPMSVKGKTMNIVLNASPLRTQHYELISETDKEPNRVENNTEKKIYCLV